MLSDIFRFIKRHKISIIFLFVLAAASALLIYLSSGETLLKGIKIEGIDVSKMSASDAKEVLTSSISQKYSDSKLLFKYGDRTWDFRLEDIAYRFMVDEAVGRAYNLSRSGDIFERAFKRIKLALNDQTLRIGISYDRDMLTEILRKIKLEIDTGEKNAEIAYSGGKISFKQDIVGSRLDVDKNLQLIENQLVQRNFGSLELNVDKVLPAIRYEDIKDISGVISNFSTTFNGADVNRSDNIRLACNRLNGRILMPGEEFSMNDTLGARTVENGYKEAPVILKNELVAGTGGGICQVTTTLYDTVLLARLNVTERSHHSMPLGYVKPGQDATISEGSIDFKFVNSSSYPINLSAEVTGNTIRIRILGRKSDYSETVRLVPVVVAEYPPGKEEIEFDPSVKIGDRVVEIKPRKGVRAILYRDIYSKEGKLLQREKISEDYYKPVTGLIKINRNFYSEYSALSDEAREALPGQATEETLGGLQN